MPDETQEREAAAVVWPPLGTAIRPRSDVPLTRAFDVVRFYVERLAVEKPQTYEVLVGNREGDVRLSDACSLVLAHIDRLTRELREARAELDRRKRVPLEQAMALAAERLARFEALAREARAMDLRFVQEMPSALLARLAALAGPAGESPRRPAPPVHDDDTGHQELGA